MTAEITKDIIARLKAVKKAKDVNEDLLGFLNSALLGLYVQHFSWSEKDLTTIEAMKLARMQVNETIDNIIIYEASEGKHQL